MKITRLFDLTGFKNKGKEEQIKQRFYEIFKSIRHPAFNILSDGTGDYVIFKQKNGVVEYKLKAHYNECIMILCDLKEIKETMQEPQNRNLKIKEIG